MDTEWVDIVIDDRLPYYANGSLVFCSNKTETNEMWGALLEVSLEYVNTSIKMFWETSQKIQKNENLGFVVFVRIQ